MTSAQCSGIPSPAKGLMVFDTDTNTFWFYGGTSWTTLSTGWALNGNIGIDPASQFLGTSDNKPLVVKINNEPSGQIYPTGNQNVSWGYSTLKAITTGNDNTAIGAKVLTGNTTGSQNTGLGSGALLTNTTGGSNVAIGTSSLYANTTGSVNVAVGS